MRLLVSLLCLTRLLAHIYCEKMFGVVGENVTFPGKRGEKVMDIRWTKDKHKVAEWEEQNKPKYFEQYHDRTVLTDDGSLTIRNLKKTDTGTYDLRYLHTGTDHHSEFQLEVFDFFPEPKISCNTSGDNLVLKCTADFQRPLNYTWKLSNDWSDGRQNLFIPLEKVNRTMQATCIIKLSQIERSSEISLNQCFPDEKGESSYKRDRGGLIAAVVLFIVAVGILVFIIKKGIIKCETRRTAQKNSPVNGSGEREQLFPGNSQEQPNTEGAVVLAHGSETAEVETMDESEGVKRRRMAAFSQDVHRENEEPEADRELKEEDSAKKDKQTVNGVNQEDTFKKRSSLQASHADDHGINEGEVTQGAEGGDGEHLDNSRSCTKGDLES